MTTHEFLRDAYGRASSAITKSETVARVHSAGTSAVEAMTETIGRGARDARDALERSTSVREGVLETMLRARRAETVRERRERWDERRRRRAATRVWCSRGRGTTGDARGDADSMD